MNSLYKKLLLIGLGVASLNAVKDPNPYQEHRAVNIPAPSTDSLIVLIDTESSQCCPNKELDKKEGMLLIFQYIILNYHSLIANLKNQSNHSNPEKNQIDINIVYELFTKSYFQLFVYHKKNHSEIKEYYLQQCRENTIFSESNNDTDLIYKKFILYIIDNFNTLFEKTHSTIDMNNYADFITKILEFAFEKFA